MTPKSFCTWVSSRICAMAWRRAWRSPRLPSVISFSTIGRSSLALGSVVTICSCLISAADMLANIALRWLAVRFSFRLVLPWRISYSLGASSHDGRLASPAGWFAWSRVRTGKPEDHFSWTRLVVIFVALGQIVDVLWRPIRHVHPQVQTHLGQHFLDFVERLAPEIGS